MYILFIIWFVLLLIMQIVYLIKTIKSNRNWSFGFTIIISSILSVILFWCYCLFNSSYIGWTNILNFIICVISIIVYSIILLIAIILKILEIKKVKKIGDNKQKLDKKKQVIIPTVLIMVMSFCLCVIDYSSYIIKEKLEHKRYNEIKEEKLQEMVNFINDKYDLNFSIEDAIYYREEDYSTHKGFLFSEKYNIPYISIFENEGQKITVVDRKGIISDNVQLKEINYFVANYFSNIVGTDIEFVQIRKASNGSIIDDTINKILQYGFNEKITSDNINSFMNEVFKEEDLELIFYIKDSENRDELIHLLTNKLSYLKNERNLNHVMLYIYNPNEELIVNEEKVELVGDFKYDNLGEDNYYDDYKFGYYYVPNDFEYFYPNKFENEKFNTFVASAYLNQKKECIPKQETKKIEVLNDWCVYTY